jgi:hypothetical protein
MFEAFSKSQWNWTWRFLLLGCASVLVFLLSGLLSGLFHTQGGVTYYMAALSLAGFVVGVIGALVSFVTIMLRRPIQRCER